MPLTQDELVRLEAARRKLKRTADSRKKTALQLAIEYLETQRQQLQQALSLLTAVAKERDASWCFRVKRSIRALWARANLWVQ